LTEFFAALRKEPEYEWEIFRPLFGATIGEPRWATRLPKKTVRLFQRNQRRRLRRWSDRGFAGPMGSRRRPTRGFAGPVRLGPFIVYDPQEHAAALAAAYPNCSPTEIEGQLRLFRAAKAVLSLRIKARDHRRAVERADIYFDQFAHTIRYIIAPVGDQYDVGVFDHDRLASLRYFALSTTFPHPLKGMHTHGVYHPIDLGHPYFRATVWGHDKIWSLIDDDYHGNIQGKGDWLRQRLLLAIQWVGKGVRDRDVGRGRQFVQYMFALEALLTSRSYDVPITDRLAEYAAFIIEDDEEARIRCAEKVASLYDKRSHIAHGRTHEVSGDDVADALDVVRRITATMLTKTPFASMTTMEQLDKWVAAQRYGGKGKYSSRQ